MWSRNCLFVAVCLAGAGLVANTLLRRERIAPPRAVNTIGARLHRTTEATDDFASSLVKLNAVFHDHWREQGMQPAPAADHLTIARRLSLALVGTVPSLEEIRALESVEAEERVAWWTSHRLEDRRF